jgi:ATP-dependent RNA helicase DDX18/HAS1
MQASAYRALLSSARHVVLGDHAGSGKTLAYLLPLIQHLKQEEQQLGRAATVPHCPRVIVVVPTAGVLLLCPCIVGSCGAASSTCKD